MSNDPRFFGYGSLVNTATHNYRDLRPARAQGWARLWRHTALRDVAFLTAVRDSKSTIEGLTAAVPNSEWGALDERETGYDRLPLEGHLNTAIYAIDSAKQAPPSVRQPILLSYLDVVVQGYLKEFGEAGAALFFATTHGWDAPILNDRAAPRYPRHQILSSDEALFVEDALAALDCQILHD